jgi:hypothetical protein
MKIKSIAAVGAMGVGLGLASFVGGTATASADQCGESPTGFTPSNIICNINAQTGTFAMSVNPATNIDTFLNGTSTTTCEPSSAGSTTGTCSTSNGRPGRQGPTRYVRAEPPGLRGRPEVALITRS